MVKPQDEKSEATNRHISSSTKCNSKQTVEKSNERPEWLPDGWNVDFRTRKSGANMGHGYKCYIDPTGHKFYSKPEVLRYVETVNSNSGTSKKEEICKSNDAVENSTVEDLPPGLITEVKIRKGSNGNRIDPDVVDKSSVEDLPPGWITEAKVRKGGNSNKKDLFYIDPVSGYVFRSKKDALRYLKSGDISTCVLKPYKRHIQDEDKITDAVEKSTVEDLPHGQITEVKTRKGNNGNKIEPDVVKKSSVEDLPPGWITEVKVRKGGNGNKKDLFYTDPVSGYVFRSKKGVLRYLKSGDITTSVLKPYKRQIQDEDKIALSSTGKKQKIEQSATKRQLFVGQEIYDESALELPDASDSIKGQDVTDSSRMMVAPVTPGEPVVKNQSLENASARTPKMKKTSDPDDVQKKNHVNMLEHASKKNHSNRSLSKTKELNVAHRFSRRLSAAEPDQLTNVANEQALQVPKRNLRKSRSVLDTDLTNKSFLQLNGALEIEHSHKMQGGVLLTSNKSSNKKEQQILCRASKRLASKRPAMELADHASINGESSNKDSKLPETTPITSNQLKKFDDEEMNNDEKSEPEQSFAFHYSWSDPGLEFAIQTLTGALPVEDSFGNGPARILETDLSPKNKLVENVTGSNSDKTSQVNSKKSKNKKELTMPRRLSKRLAGHEPDVLPPEKAIEYATRKSCNDKPAATAILTNHVSGQIHAREESKLVVQASDRLKTCDESSSKSEKSYDSQTVPNEQLQRLEAENVDDDKLDAQFSSLFGDSWSDPCLEFAIKTLTGALPVDAPAAADILPVMTPDANDPPNKELLESMEQKSINEEALDRDNPNQSQTKKAFNTVCQPLKQVLNLNQPELTTYSTSCGNDPKFATRESYKDEDSMARNFNARESQRTEAGNARQIDINKTILEEEPSEEKQVLEDESVAEKLQPETINHDSSERAFCVSFMESWSDPCLDFAFKTLTGTIPIEENIAIQGCFQEPANGHDQRGGGSMVPDFGFSSGSHNGFSFHNDIGEKSKPRQQSSTSSLPPEEKPSPHGFSGVAPQEQYFQYSNNFQRR